MNITSDGTHGVARPESNFEGTSVKPKLRDILQTARPLPSKCPGHESQRKTKECPRLKESQETRPLHAAGDPDLDPLQKTPLGQMVDPEWGLRIRKMLFVLYLQLLCTFLFLNFVNYFKKFFLIPLNWILANTLLLILLYWPVIKNLRPSHWSSSLADALTSCFPLGCSDPQHLRSLPASGPFPLCVSRTAAASLHA